LAGEVCLTQAKAGELSTFLAPSPRVQIDRLMSSFIDETRMKRAKEIPDGDLKLIMDTKERVEVQVRDYQVVIDLGKREILHDCPDWDRRAPNLQFCKHIAKLILFLSEERSEAIIQKLSSEKDRWSFRTLGR